MIIGILSDTHNHLRETRFALDRLVAAGAQVLVHCGDAGEDVMDLLSALFLEHGIRSHVAYGNTDPHQDARFLPQPAGVERGRFLTFELDGKRCAVLHGDNAHALSTAIDSREYAYVFTGHTHRAADRIQGRTRVINPGSPARPRGGPPGMALLDLKSGTLTFLPL